MFSTFDFFKSPLFAQCKYFHFYLVFVLFLFISDCRFSSCSQVVPENFQKEFSDHGLVAIQNNLIIPNEYDNNQNTILNYITVTTANSEFPINGKYIIFIHGSPGDWSDYKHLLTKEELVRDFVLISVDRPGFGGSTRGKAILSLRDQGNQIAFLIKNLKNPKQVILVGHSFGGPVAVRISMDYPELVDGLLLVAGSISPELEKKEWFNYVAEWQPVKFVLPIDIDTSNQEILELKNELNSMLPLWKKILIPVGFLHGAKDSLVPIENVEFGQKILAHNNNLIIDTNPEWNHFLPWNQYDKIAWMIYKIDERIKK